MLSYTNALLRLNFLTTQIPPSRNSAISANNRQNIGRFDCGYLFALLIYFHLSYWNTEHMCEYDGILLALFCAFSLLAFRNLKPLLLCLMPLKSRWYHVSHDMKVTDDAGTHRSELRRFFLDSVSFQFRIHQITNFTTRILTGVSLF